MRIGLAVFVFGFLHGLGFDFLGLGFRGLGLDGLLCGNLVLSRVAVLKVIPGRLELGCGNGAVECALIAALLNAPCLRFLLGIVRRSHSLGLQNFLRSSFRCGVELVLLGLFHAGLKLRIELFYGFRHEFIHSLFTLRLKAVLLLSGIVAAVIL